jgi:hypothetical protein
MSETLDQPEPLPCNRDVISDEEFHELGLCIDHHGNCTCEEVMRERQIAMTQWRRGLAYTLWWYFVVAVLIAVVVGLRRIFGDSS